MAAGTISVRQGNAMLFIVLAGGWDAFLPRYMAAAAGRDALWSVGLATALTIGAAGVVIVLGRRRITDLGVWSLRLGRSAGAWPVLFLVLVAALPLAGVGLVGSVTFGWWAVAVPPLVMATAGGCTLAAGRGLGTVARLSEYAAPAAFLLTLLVAVIAAGRVDWSNYAARPDWGPVWRGTLYLLGRFALAGVVLLLVPPAGRETPWLWPVTILAAGFVLGVETLPVGLYSGGTAAAAFLPFLELLYDSLPGPAYLVTGLWLLAMAFQVVVILRVTATGLSRTADPPPFLLPAVAVAWAGLLLWSNAGGAYNFDQACFAYLGLPALLLLGCGGSGLTGDTCGD